MKTEDQLILDAIRRQLPVGYIPNHVNDNLPEMVAYHVKRSGILGKIEDDARTLLEEEAGPKGFIQLAETIVEMCE